VEKELSEKGLTPNLIGDVFNAFENAKPDKYLQEVMDVLKNMDLQHDNVIFDSKLARGLDYYTGPIYETTVIEPKIGSITGGGRYDGLLKSLGGPDLPAVGTTIGLDRAVDVIEELGLWKNLPSTSSQILITVFSSEFENKSIKVADKIRKQGINTEIYPNTNTKLDKQLKYADKKGIKWLVVIGPDEVKKDTVILKDLQSGHQEETEVDRLISKIKG
jgi:histidyl-tRNA synthetase